MSLLRCEAHSGAIRNGHILDDAKRRRSAALQIDASMHVDQNRLVSCTP
ncbi:hypothetical protein BREVUG8_110281 [Brevundimonas sp. G8]|nr:hypothetical protein BREVUG8_110281 [Brevundimonas sp. G8]